MPGAPGGPHPRKLHYNKSQMVHFKDLPSGPLKLKNHTELTLEEAGVPEIGCSLEATPV